MPDCIAIREKRFGPVRVGTAVDTFVGCLAHEEAPDCATTLSEVVGGRYPEIQVLSGFRTVIELICGY